MKKSILLSSAIAAATLLTAVNANADVAIVPGFKPCSVATLKGLYVFNSRGILSGNAYTDSGHEYFDGKGKVRGHVVDSTGAEHELVGTYTVNGECEGKITYTAPEAAEESVFLGPDGEVLSYIQTGENTAISGTEIRQSSKFFRF